MKDIGKAMRYLNWAYNCSLGKSPYDTVLWGKYARMVMTNPRRGIAQALQHVDRVVKPSERWKVDKAVDILSSLGELPITCTDQDVIDIYTGFVCVLQRGGIK